MRAVAAARPGYCLLYIGSAAPLFSVLRQADLQRRGTLPIDEWSFTMDKELQSLLFQQWTNGACRGYVIWAMENCDFSPDDIKRVVSELHYVFDICGIEEAEAHYQNSPY